MPICIGSPLQWSSFCIWEGGLNVIAKDEIEARVRDLWGLVSDPVLIGRTQNRVYSSVVGDDDVIVRISDSRHRSREMLLAEIEWMTFLERQGIRVSLPIASKRAKVIETVEMGDVTLHVIVFPKAKGRAVQALEEIDEALAIRWGRVLGKMNRVSVGFEARTGFRKSTDDPGIQSLSWHAKRLNSAPSRLLEIAEWAESLPKVPEAYGLIHGDFQYLNFFYDDEEIYPFDFDDCCYHWRVADIANPLYCIYFDLSRSNGDLSRLHSIKEHLVAGFVSECPGIEPWLEGLNRFIEYRICLLYCWCHNRENRPHWMAQADPAWHQFLLDWSGRELDQGHVSQLP